MKKIFILIYTTVFCINVSAQNASIATGFKVSPAGKVITQVKFLFPDKVISDYSLNVFRKASDESEWKKLNTTPLTKASMNEKFTDEDYKYYQSFSQRKRAENADDENNAQAMAGLLIIDNNNFARYAGCYYEDASAEEGKAYQYKITNAANGDKEIAITKSSVVKKDYLPVVNSIRAVQKKQLVLLFWKEENAFFAYNVYKKNSADGTSVLISPDAIMIGVVGEEDTKNKKEMPLFVDSFVNESTVYYEITGIDVLGNESQKSAPFKIEIKDLTPPPIVQNLNVKRDNKNAILTWEANKNKDIVGYNVFRNTSNDTSFKKINSSLIEANASSYSDIGLKEGDVYGYKIESVDKANNTALSRYVLVFFPDQSPPAKPKGLKAISRPGIVQITWDKNTEADLKGYYIYRASNRDKDYFNMLYRYPITGEMFIDTLPSIAKNEFVYNLQAVDEDYNVSVPSDTVIVLLPDTVAPLQPIIKNLRQVDNSVVFEVDLRDDDADIVGYDLYMSKENNNRFQKINRNSITEKTYRSDISEFEQEYYYYIVSVDGSGNISPASNKANIYIQASEVALVAANSLKANYNIRDSSIELSWVNGATNVSGYIVYRKENNEQFKAVSEVIKIDNFKDSTVAPGVQYEYSIRTLFKESTAFSNSESVVAKAE